MSNKCLCINHICAKETKYGIRSFPCLDNCETIKAERVYGAMPSLMDDSELVIMLRNPPLDAVRLLLKQGGWTLLLPTRASFLDERFVVLFSMMTNPAPRILATTILEVHGVDQVKLESALRGLYGDNLIVEDLVELGEGDIYRVHMEKEKKMVVFKVKI